MDSMKKACYGELYSKNGENLEKVFVYGLGANFSGQPVYDGCLAIVLLSTVSRVPLMKYMKFGLIDAVSVKGRVTRLPPAQMKHGQTYPFLDLNEIRYS